MRMIPWVYDLFMAPAERTRVGHWRHFVAGAAHGIVVEIGAGTGLNFPSYGPEAFVIATDVDVRMLKRSRRRLWKSRANIFLVAADAEALPFRESAFDSGVVGLALCTIPHPDAALSELRRVLKDDAPVGLLEHVRVRHPIIGRLQDWLTPAWRIVAGGCHLNRRTEETIAENGFAIEVIQHHAGGFALAIVARRVGRVSSASGPLH